MFWPLAVFVAVEVLVRVDWPAGLRWVLARFLGLKVAAISTITNMAAGLSDESISHDHTKAMAPLGAKKLERVLRRFLASSGR